MEAYLYDDLYELEEKHWWHRAKRALILRLLPAFLPKRKLKILDVGCGTGKNVEEFSRWGESWGLDVSTQALSYCKKRGLQHLKKGEAERTGLPAGSFDVVTLLDVLEHTDDNKTLSEMYRILKPHGLLVMTVPAYQWLFSRWDVVLHHKRRYGKGDIEKLFRVHGFAPLKVSYVYSFLIVPVAVIRLFKSVFMSGSYGSDFKMSSPLVNKVMSYVCSLERWWIGIGSIPFGTSIVCVASRSKRVYS